MVRLAETDEEIARAFPVMQQLRPHLEESAFVSTVRRLQRGGFHLVLVDEEGRVVAAGGYRFIENLVSGRTLMSTTSLPTAASGPTATARRCCTG